MLTAEQNQNSWWQQAGRKNGCELEYFATSTYRSSYLPSEIKSYPSSTAACLTHFSCRGAAFSTWLLSSPSHSPSHTPSAMAAFPTTCLSLSRATLHQPCSLSTAAPRWINIPTFVAKGLETDAGQLYAFRSRSAALMRLSIQSRRNKAKAALGATVISGLMSSGDIEQGWTQI